MGMGYFTYVKRLSNLIWFGKVFQKPLIKDSDYFTLSGINFIPPNPSSRAM